MKNAYKILVRKPNTVHLEDICGWENNTEHIY